jgi:hypothetical protein
MGSVVYLLHLFDQTPVKIAGAAVMLFLLGFAAGNSHRTEAVLKGQQAYFVQHEQKAVHETRHEDAAVIGVPEPVLKAAVDATKKANQH